MLSRLLCVLHFCAIKVSRNSSIVKRNASLIICRSSHRWSSIKKVLLKIMENSLENSSARVSFLKNFAGLKPATLFKKRLWHSCFPASFAKFLRTDFKLIISIRLQIYLLIFVKNHIWTCKQAHHWSFLFLRGMFALLNSTSLNQKQKFKWHTSML